MTRWIKSEEKCYSALEIVGMFQSQYGVYLHPTNIGNAAKKLELDFLEGAIELLDNGFYTKPIKLYSEVDLPKIYILLKELADRRTQYE